MEYEMNWKGLDQGVEHTWRPDVIIGGLKAIAKYAPVKHRDPESPFYKSMEELFPDKTWRAYDREDGSFRPVFRRSNTWKKLGLIVEHDKEFSLSLTGSQLLKGIIQLSDIYSSVFRNHIEGDERPFVILASLLAQLQLPEIDVDLIIYLLHRWRPGDDLRQAYDSYGTDKSELHEDIYKTRRRRINAMLRLFASMGAITVSREGVAIKDLDLLTGIGELTELEEAYFEEFDATAELEEPEREPPVVQPRKRSTSAAEIKQFTNAAGKTTDPEKKLRLLERATKSHEDTVSQVAEYFESKGLESFEHPISYDLYTPLNNQDGFLFEIKSITKQNCHKQIREAVSQLHEYNFRFSDQLSDTNHLVIVVDQNPIGLLDSWVFDYLAQDRNILLMWFSDGKPTSTDHFQGKLDRIKQIN